MLKTFGTRTYGTCKCACSGDIEWNLNQKANLKNIFVSPYPTLFYPYGLVCRNFFFNFSNGYPLNLIVSWEATQQNTKKKIVFSRPIIA